MHTSSNPRHRTRIVAVALLGFGTSLTLMPDGAAEQTTTTAPANAVASARAETLVPTPQINGVVWDLVMVGNVVYVGGEFRTARPFGAAAGHNEVSRSNLMAFDVTTGAILPGTPAVNGPVRALAVSNDRTRVYLGGRFATVGGQAHANVAAVNTSTQAVDHAWQAGTNATVRGLATSTDTVYAGGDFDQANGEVRGGLAAFGTTGSLQAWAPRAEGGSVKSIAVKPDNSRVVVGGQFATVNGSEHPGRGLALLDGRTGAVVPTPLNRMLRPSSNGAVTSLVARGDTVYGAGFQYGPMPQGVLFEGTFAMDWNGRARWVNTCAGDSYDVMPIGSLLYVASHAHNCDGIGGFPETSPRQYHRGMAFTLASSGKYNRARFTNEQHSYQTDFLPDFDIGQVTGLNQGPWAVTGDSRFAVYGGEFMHVDGRPQQGLATLRTRPVRVVYTERAHPPAQVRAEAVVVTARRAHRAERPRTWRWSVRVANQTSRTQRVVLRWRHVRTHRSMVRVYRLRPHTVLRRGPSLSHRKPSLRVNGRVRTWRTVPWRTLRPRS